MFQCKQILYFVVWKKLGQSSDRYILLCCELKTSDTHSESLSYLYANSIHAALGVNDLAAVKNYFTSDGILFIKNVNKYIQNNKNN